MTKEKSTVRAAEKMLGDGEDGKDVSLHVDIAVDECFAQRNLIRLTD